MPSAPDASGTGGVVTSIGGTQLAGFDERIYKKALDQAGFNAAPRTINYAGAIAIVVWLSALDRDGVRPPANIRATSLSLPYHLGVGILGGFLPFAASALVIYQGNIFAGLWYPVGIAFATAVVGNDLRAGNQRSDDRTSALRTHDRYGSGSEQFERNESAIP